MAIRKSRHPLPPGPSYKYLVSACLAGIRCTYNGNDKLDRRIRLLVGQGKALPVCPEVLGGSNVPRPCCEIRGGDGAGVLDGFAKAVTGSGRDISRVLTGGAARTLAIAKRYGIRNAILKSKSPSCGVGRIYDGSFTGRLVKGDGVTAALLRRSGVNVITEKGKIRGE